MKGTSLTKSTNKYIFRTYASSNLFVDHCMDIFNGFQHRSFIVWGMLEEQKIQGMNVSGNVSITYRSIKYA